MSEPTPTKSTPNDERGVHAAAAGLGVQTLLAVVLAGLGLALYPENSARPGLLAAATFTGIAMLPWLGVLLVLRERQAVREERLLAASRQTAEAETLFDADDDLSRAQSRLRTLERFGLPLLGVLTGGGMVAAGWGFIAAAPTEVLAPGTETALSPLAIGFTLLGCAFTSFLTSRTIAGLSRAPELVQLRGGASGLMGGALLSAAISLAGFLEAGLATPTTPGEGGLAPLSMASRAIPFFLVVLGAETLLILFFDLYRPRRAGEIARPAFESRLLGLLTAPGSMARSLHEALQYQFGFDVTGGWLWKLLSDLSGWLLVFALLTLFAISSVVLVGPHERGLVTTLGRLQDEVLEPGLHWKLPYPISQVERHDVTSLRSIRAGTDKELLEDTPILWANVHTKTTPQAVLVQAASSARDEEDTTPAIAVVNAEVDVLYRPRADDLRTYALASADANPDDRLRVIAYRLITRSLLAADVDHWIGRARETAGEEFARELQRLVDAEALGLEIVLVAVSSIHPPQEVAESFHEVVGAEQERRTAVARAEGVATRELSAVTGSMELAASIVEGVELLEELHTATRAAPDDTAARARVLEQEVAVERLLLSAGGQAAQVIAAARAERWGEENAERARAESQAAQLAGFEASPQLYRARSILEMLRRTLPDARKIVLAASYRDLTLRTDLGGLDTGLGELFGGEDE